MEILEKNELELLESSIKVSQSIDKLYTSLYELEINGKKESKEYKEYVEYLKIAVDVYDSLFEEAKLKPKRCRELINYIEENITTFSNNNDIESILEQDYNNRHIRRIFNTLFNKSLTDDKYFKNTYVKEMKDFLKYKGINDILDEVIYNIINQSIELNTVFKKDYFKGFLSFVQNTISMNNQYKNQLIESKYNASFINKDIEQQMIDNNFSLSEQFYTSSSFIKTLIQLDDRAFDGVKDFFFSKIANIQIEKILELKDSDYKDEKKASSAILRICLLRSTFTFINDSTLEDINFKYHKNIEDTAYLKLHKEDKISESLISKAFRNIRSDKEKQIITNVKNFII